MTRSKEKVDDRRAAGDRRGAADRRRLSPDLIKFSISISKDIGERARRLTFEERLSESSIFDVALRLLLGERTDAQVADIMRQHGATLRRRYV